MSENLDQPTQPPSFAAAVLEALTRLNFKPKCSGCSAIGWGNFDIFQAPVYAPIIMSDQGIPAACLICQKCGQFHMKHLKVLGITLTREERKVLTASELAAQQPQRSGLILP